MKNLRIVLLLAVSLPLLFPFGVERTSLAGVAALNAADERGFLDRVYKDETGEHKYVVFVPEAYTPDRKWPVILFLHGAGERGSDGKLQTTVGLGPIVKARSATFQFVAVFPQCEDARGRLLEGWLGDSENGKRALKILDVVEKELSIDPARRVLTGWSMGGYGAWSIAASTPQHWAAVVPLAGGGDPAWADKLKSVPIWAFHGADDAAIRPEQSRRMIAALEAAGAKPRYTEIKNVDHDVWKVVYDQDDLYQWMLNPTTDAAPSDIAFHARPGQRQKLEADAAAPFVPAVEMSRAVYVRLGNEMLDTLSFSIPKLVPADALSGQLEDMQDFTRSEGRDFQVDFTRINYSGELARAKIQAYGKDRLNVQLGLKDIRIRIGRTYVTGQNHSATAGATDIVIGHREPVWLNFDVTPLANERTLRTQLLATEFDIPDDNWYVTSPAGIGVRGLGMTREKVSDGIVSGLYENKARIEQGIRDLVPSVLKQLEQKLEVKELSGLVQSFWPLPVYRPRIRVWPDQIATDENGISVVFGVTAAAIDPARAPAQPEQVDLGGLLAADVPQVAGLQIGVAPNVLSPLTNLLIDADIARIHVLDIPESRFTPFADAKMLSRVVPDLKQFGDDVEIWSELVLAAPLTVTDMTGTSPDPKSLPSGGGNAKGENAATVSTSDASPAAAAQANAAAQFQFSLPRVLISLAVKKPAASDQWTPYAEFEIRVDQAAETGIDKPNYETRALKLGWSGNPKVVAKGRFAPGYQPQSSEMNLEEISRWFADGWLGWTSQGAASQTAIPDIDFGLTKLRLSAAGWTSPYLFVAFARPGVKITNSANVPLVYDTQGPNSGWGGPYTLESGKSHEYDIAYPLIYRQRTNQGQVVFTLPVGSHSEFRVPDTGGPPALYQARESIPQPTESLSAAPRSSN